MKYPNDRLTLNTQKFFNKTYSIMVSAYLDIILQIK